MARFGAKLFTGFTVAALVATVIAQSVHIRQMRAAEYVFLRAWYPLGVTLQE
jgi:hypothetical protein